MQPFEILCRIVAGSIHSYINQHPEQILIEKERRLHHLTVPLSSGTRHNFYGWGEVVSLRIVVRIELGPQRWVEQ